MEGGRERERESRGREKEMEEGETKQCLPMFLAKYDVDINFFNDIIINLEQQHLLASPFHTCRGLKFGKFHLLLSKLVG